ncbi:MAG TPA: type II toxin-antitoxin system RelE/ParE family toxin [Gemmatimonadales bacterium]|nr:type II toxin-antitoxin system RelE/ParE family toxin [Gemmatimonadales bacterium]
MRVRFTPTGERQFLQVIAYILADRPSAARRFHTRATKVLSRLEKFPDSGRRLPEFPELPYREVIVRPYRFFYRVQDDTVWVVGVWHGAQLPVEPGAPEGA